MPADVIRTGGACAVIVAVLYAVVGINHFLWPATASPEALMQVLVDRPIYHYIDTLGFALIAILLIPVITATGGLLQPVHAGLSRWATMIGYIGCAGTMMNNFRMLQLVPRRAAVFIEGDETVRAAIQYNWLGNSLDPYGWLQFGFFGFWLLVVAFLVLRQGNGFPRGYGYLALVAACLNLMILATNLSLPIPASLLAALSGIVVGPAWAISTAILLYRQAGMLQPRTPVGQGIHHA